MFYTISEDIGQILTVARNCPDPDMQAQIFQCDVYIIEGQHTGLKAEFSKLDHLMATLSNDEKQELAKRIRQEQGGATAQSKTAPQSARKLR